MNNDDTCPMHDIDPAELRRLEALRLSIDFHRGANNPARDIVATAKTFAAFLGGEQEKP